MGEAVERKASNSVAGGIDGLFAKLARTQMPTAWNVDAWAGFFSAQIAASAALAGLIFVAVSINLTQIISGHNLVARSAKALFTLTGILLVSVMAIVPAQPLRALAIELLIAGIAMWLAISWAGYAAGHNNPYVSRANRIFQRILTQLAGLPILGCAISLLLHRGGGLYWLVVAVVFSYITSLSDAWVLLIEIHR